MKPLQANWENFGILGLLAREARGKFWEFLPWKTVFLMNFGYVCSKIFETPLGQIGEFLRIFETPPTQIGPWAKIFETPPEELVAGGDLKARHRQHAERGGNTGSPRRPNSDLEILVTFLIIGLERSDFMRILDLKFLKFGLNFEMLTWTFPKSQNLPNLKIFSQNLGKSTSVFQNLTQISV